MNKRTLQRQGMLPMRRLYWLVVVLMCLVWCAPVLSGAKEAGNVPLDHHYAKHERAIPPLDKEHDLAYLKDTHHSGQTITGSSVNHLTRRYTTNGPGMFVKVPGGFLSIRTTYERGSWFLGPARNGMDGKPFEKSGLDFHEIGDDVQGKVITSILKEGKFGYNLPPENVRLKTEYDAHGNLIGETYEYVGEQVYFHQEENMTFRIKNVDEGYRWEDKYGNWKLYAGNSEDDTRGQLLSFGNRRGTTADVLYDANNRVIGYADRRGVQVFRMTYNPEGLIATVQDYGNRRIEYTYDANGRLWKVKDVLGDETEYRYDAEGRITKVIKPGGREANITYNDYGDVASVLNAEVKGYYFEFDYDKTKKEYYALIRSSSDQIKEVWYDEEVDTKRVAINGTTVQTIQKDGNALLITDERGLVTRKEYDEWENLTKIIYPDSSVVSYAYEHKYNRRIRDVDERGIVTEYMYDEHGNLLKQIEATGTDVERMTEYTYYPDGSLETLIVHIDNTTTAVTRLEYDAVGNLIKVTDPEGNTIEMTYDIMGNMLTRKDGRGKVWQHGYDAIGRVISLTDPLDNTTQRVYNAAGNLEKVIDPNLHETTYQYDVQNHAIHITNGAGTSTFRYNANDNLIRQTDPEGRQLFYEYDDNGRRIKISDGNGNEIRVEYVPLSGSSSSCPSCSGGRTNQPSRII